MERRTWMFIITTTIALMFSTAVKAMDPVASSSVEAPAKWKFDPQQQGQSEHGDYWISPSFVSEVAAVASACNIYNPVSIQEDREYIGAVLKHKTTNHYHYTVAAGESGEDRIHAEIVFPKEYEVIAFWHTHGAGKGSRHYFSKYDTALVQQWNKPFYLSDSSGYLKVFNPDDRIMSSYQARKVGLGHAKGSAKGNKVRDSRGETVRIRTE
ncbi:DUF4329 domain-containing protein [Endozoicomonas numazuensis]|uniref:DUF4329 domain-containing protein n=1 Tax=Endozoicomonas numazuensis TaxID=1137799 RepID=A0A081NGS2_9GAMM|nr:DUF4329 domain-containing protein [Endozoicomonas numazuensis]KEQ17645.1 hypothetical protein GZ78_18160 [Endozoicomonas numazuensis]